MLNFIQQSFHQYTFAITIAVVLHTYMQQTNFPMQKVKEQFKGKKLIHSKDFVMQSGQHLTLEYEEVKPDSDWSVTLNQKKVVITLDSIDICICIRMSA